MIKLSAALAVAGLALLALSALPARGLATGTPAAPTSAPTVSPALTDASYGKALFLAKGCATCHHHAAVPGSGALGEGDVPDLTKYRWNADYLRSWLKDPAAVKPGTYMPTLGLHDDEIEALIAFLSAGKE